MITISKDTALNAANLKKWYDTWQREIARLDNLMSYYLNRITTYQTEDLLKQNVVYQPILKVPFAKKLVTIASAATFGDGVTVSQPKDLDAAQIETYNTVQRLLKQQIIEDEDLKIITDGGIFGKSYELSYMSEDEVPVPKVTRLDPRSACVIYDDTVEHNPLYAFYIIRKNIEYGRNETEIVVYDDTNYYTMNLRDLTLAEPKEHNMGYVPIVEYSNNNEQQSDFEQVIPLMLDRTTLHELTLADTNKIVKNMIVLINAKLAGKTKEDKELSIKDINSTAVLELDQDNSNKPMDAKMLSKSENYAMIDSFGSDIDSKIYDMSMIPNLSDEQFAGNQTGVALDLKLMPFKQLVKSKDAYIRKLYNKRLQMYVYALTQAKGQGADGQPIPSSYAWFDAKDCEITINRNWTKNVTEIAQEIQTLKATGLFSDEYLTNQMPDADYNIESDRLANEAKNKPVTTPDMNNPYINQFTQELLNTNAESIDDTSK